MPFRVVEAPKCPACKTSVYPAEMWFAADRTPFHRTCVKCFQCKVALNPRTINEHDTRLYCNVCYAAIFNPQEYTTDYYNGIITPEDVARQKEKERLEREKLERILDEKQCPTCGNKVYPEQASIISDVVFHKICVKCCECLRSFDGSDMHLSPGETPKPYCKFCYAKVFGISALDITEMVKIAPPTPIMAQGL